MKNSRFLWSMVGLLAAGYSVGASAQLGMNSCTGMVDAVRQGVHTAGADADGVFWPPNHKLRPVTISAENAEGDACNVTITDVRQDEAIDEAGSGNTSPDAANCKNTGNESSVDLRGERSGRLTGRYYHVMYTMEDPDAPMMPKMDEAVLLVPHDQGVAHIGTTVDEGPLFASYSGLMLQCAP